MTTSLEVVRAAKPDASEDYANHILWGRTPYPCGRVGARELYKAASGFTRAMEHGLRLCDFCESIAAPGAYTCACCESALSSNAGNNATA